MGTGSPVSAQDRPWMNTSLPPDERADLLLAQMTLEEKVGLLHERSSTEGSSARLGIPHIQGVQSHPVIATAKHYNVNAQEENRLEVNVQIDERTLQEIYTLPFVAVVQDGYTGAVMGAYNKVNGTYSCEHPHLLTEILKQQLGFRGWVVSDFEATHSTVEAANAGLELELGAAKFFGDRLLQAIQTEQVSVSTIDDKVQRILRTMFALGLFDSPVQITPLPEQEHGQVARTIASQGIVLLKNADELLPLSSQHSIAVIGADANHYITGGGSSFVKPTYVVGILEGIQRLVGENVPVEYAEGTDPVSAVDLLPGLPLVPSSVLTPAGPDPELQGLHAEYWTNTNFEGEPPKRLVGWAKIEVEPGESREVSVTLDPNATSRPLSYWNVSTNGWEVAGGEYQVYVGASSRDIRLTGFFRVRRLDRA